MKQLAFIAMVIGFLGLFAWNFRVFIRILQLGKDPKLTETLGDRVASLNKFFFGQRKVMEERRSWHHLGIYWGFLVLQLAAVDMLLTGILGDWFNLGIVLGEPLYAWMRTLVDVGTVVVLLVIVYAMVRRVVFRPEFVPLSMDAMLILGGIATLNLTHFGHQAWHMAFTGQAEAGPVVSYEIGRLLGLYSPIQGSEDGALTVYVDKDLAHLASQLHGWVHMVIFFAFLNYLPFSKHIHLLGSGPNIFLRRQSKRGISPRVELFEGNDLEEGEPLMENWGVGRIENFDWKSLLDNYSCTECARCTTYCPAFATAKPLSPMHLIHDLKDEMNDRGKKLVQLKKCGVNPPSVDGETGELKWMDPPTDADKGAVDKIDALKKMLDDAPPLVGGRIKDDTLWACTTCGACAEVCPVFIDHPLKILQMRSHIILNDESGRTPAEVTTVISNITEGQGNPWNIPASDRLNWTRGLDVPLLADHPDAEYLFFVGCAGAYDEEAKKTTRALVKIMQAAGVDFAIMGEDEACTGDTVRRLGDEMNFQIMADAQVKVLNELKVKKIITSCPHCLHTIKNEYPQFGGMFETIHHTELIAHLLEQGKLKVENPLEKRVTYHDSCYLGRWNKIYDSPRAILGAATGKAGEVIELDRNKEHGFCCGAGGGRMWVEEEPEKRVNVNRSAEIIKSGVDAVAVGCPFCKTMISDGMKHFNKDEDIEVMDLAQMLASTLADPPATAASEPGSELDDRGGA